jgi:GxxExxY protein
LSAENTDRIEEFYRQDAKFAEEKEEERERLRIEPIQELDELAHRVIGAAIEVHRHLGPGFFEAVYEEALAIEFGLRDIAFERQKTIKVDYKEAVVGEGKLDFLVASRLIVELKTVEALSPIHKAQVISYLRATRLHLGLLINFNVPVLKNGLQRVILS